MEFVSVAGIFVSWWPHTGVTGGCGLVKVPVEYLSSLNFSLIDSISYGRISSSRFYFLVLDLF